MKKLLGVLAICFLALGFSSPIKNVSANSSNVNISQLEINNQKNFANLNGISSFANFNDYNYYILENNLYSYNYLNHEVKKLNYHNVTNLKQTDSLVLFLTNGKLAILNNDGTKFNLDSPDIFATTFNVNNQNDITTISYISNATLGIIKFNATGEVINSFSNEIDIANVSAMAVTSKYTYLIYNHETKQNFVKINNDVDFDKTEYPFVYLDCTNLEVIEETNTLLLTHNRTSALAVLIDANNELVEKNDILAKASTTPSFALGDVSDFTDVKIINNEIFLLDSRNNANIQNFSLVNFELVPNKIVLSSVSYELGRFNNVSNIQIANLNTMYVSDTFNKRIQTIVNNNSTALTEINNQQFDLVKKIVTSDNINFYLLEANKVTMFNEESNFTISAPNAKDICVSENNELYAITTNGLYKLNNTNKFNLVLDGNFENPKIKVTNNNVLIASDKDIKVYSLNAKSVIYSTTLNYSVKDIQADYYNNIYALTDNGIVRIYYNNETNTYNSEITTSNFNYDFTSISCFGVNKVNGDIICFNNNIQALIKIESDYVSTLKNFTNPVDPHNYNKLTTLLPYGKANKVCYVFDYPHNTNFNYKLTTNSYVYILDSEAYDNYYFVMYNDNNKINFGYVKKDNLNYTTYANTTDIKVEPIYKNVKVYKFPTILKDNSNLGFVIATINQNQTLTCINKEIISLDNSKYYAIKLEDGTIGYVNSSDIRDVNTTDIKPLPNPNAKLINGVDTVNIYSEENVLSKVILELKPNAQFYVQNYDAKKELNYITYVDENKVAHYGYIETKYIVMETNNPNLTAAYVLLGIGIVLAISGISVYIAYKKGKL